MVTRRGLFANVAKTFHEVCESVGEGEKKRQDHPIRTAIWDCSRSPTRPHPSNGRNVKHLPPGRPLACASRRAYANVQDGADSGLAVSGAKTIVDNRPMGSRSEPPVVTFVGTFPDVGQCGTHCPFFRPLPFKKLKFISFNATAKSRMPPHDARAR